ncbi:hypothetical protein ScalyP_jg483 [Parmales sp. scaly parma]|nr:hypothetical protein ScalyP_jg483 [Parmales sp. scaly parma]
MALSLPSSFITPKAGHMFATERNRSNKDLQDFAEFVHILDVRCQSDIASHVVGSRSSTLIRGSVIYPFDRLKVQFAAFNVAVGAAVEAATENEDIFIEPLTANLINDPENTYLICCTDGQRSVLAWELLTSAYSCGDFRVIEGGVRRWLKDGLPTICIAGGDISSDSDSD